MCLFCANDLSTKVDDWEYFLDKHHDYIDEDEVWSFARDFEKPPHIGNLYTMILLDRIINILNEQYNVPMDNMNTEINSICSNLYVDEEQIDTMEDFDKVIERYSDELN